jgi:hypothetical protein
MNDKDAPKDKPEHSIEYTVNNEVEHTTEDELKAEVILTLAGFTPPSDYRLISENPKREYALADIVKLHNHQRFEALHRGPTPTS